MDIKKFTPPNPEIVDKLNQLTAHATQRRLEYAKVEDQLDMLFKDIEKGYFGENAKAGLFFTHINSVKTKYQKPDNLEQIKSDLDRLIELESTNNSNYRD